jgi:hypothetical protein
VHVLQAAVQSLDVRGRDLVERLAAEGWQDVIA